MSGKEILDYDKKRSIIILSLFVLGLTMWISKACNGQESFLTQLNKAEPPAITAPASITIFNQEESPAAPSNQKQVCITIDGLNPPGRQGDGLAPTAWSAWEELERPPEVVFFNLTGPDANPNNPQELNAPENLPRLVHKGDKFCRTR